MLSKVRECYVFLFYPSDQFPSCGHDLEGDAAALSRLFGGVEEEGATFRICSHPVAKIWKVNRAPHLCKGRCYVVFTFQVVMFGYVMLGPVMLC